MAPGTLEKIINPGQWKRCNMNIQDRMKILVRAPVLTQSGYGEHARFLLRSLRKYEHMIDMYVVPINWGNTNWIAEDSEERAWYDQLIG